jgi:hypothetical protein
MEKWIEGYENKYRATINGNIISYICDLPRVLKPKSTNSGYLAVVLRKNNKSKMFLVHRLIAETFIDNTYNKSYVNHKDGNRLNNCVYNLEWCTASENSQDAVKRNGTRKVAQYTKYGKKLCTFSSVKEAMQHIGVDTHSAITNCCNSKIKSAYGYIWRYADAK